MKLSTSGKGVNLGGWFIPEKWMTPQLFEGLNVTDFDGLLHSSEGLERYTEHVQEFIRESDLEELANNSVQLIRVPIAWWMIADVHAEVAIICIEQLDWLFRMAEKYNLRILLDYHAARGSQNGKDHSGKVGVVEWKKYKDENLGYMTDITRRYANSPSLWGIEPLNEPAVKGNFWTLFQYYRSAKKQLRNIVSPSVHVVIHDGFIPILFTNIIPWRSNIVLDMHLYEIPVNKGESVHGYFDRRDSLYARRIQFYKNFQPIIIGEWSGVVPEKLLKGLSSEKKEEVIRENIERQLKLYKLANAWMFWSLKSADQSMWNFQSHLEYNETSDAIT